MQTSTKAPSSSLFDVEPLSPSEVEEFLDFWNSGDETVYWTLNILSPKTQAMIQRAHDVGLLGDYSGSMLVSNAGDSLKNDQWISTVNGVELAEGIIQSTLLLAETINDLFLSSSYNRQTWVHHVRAAFIGCYYREDEWSSPVPFSDPKQLAPVASLVTFIIAAKQQVPFGRTDGLTVECAYFDREHRTFDGEVIANPVLRAYLREQSPEVAFQLGTFAGERKLSGSDEDTRAIMEYFSETSEAKAISEGWL